MNILLVDDEPFMLEQLEFLIKPMCPLSEIYTALDSSQVQQLLKKVKFHLAFIDIQLPGKSGLQIAKELKEQDQNTIIIILTAYQDFNYAKDAIKIGVSQYLTKPLIEKELLEVIDTYVKDSKHFKYTKLIMEVLNIVHEKYPDKLNLTQVAKMVHVNPSYLSRKFSEEVGLPFSDYLNDYRLEMAKNLLLTYKDFSVSEIAMRTGFNSLHYFSTLFRKKVNMTPKQYREMGRNIG